MQCFLKFPQTYPHCHSSTLCIGQGVGLPLHCEGATAFFQTAVQRLFAHALGDPTPGLLGGHDLAFGIH